MARYTGAKLRITRRLGDLPGLTNKKSKLRGQKSPGQHGASKKKAKPYGVRLDEKQKLRFNYGIGEKQLRNYVRKARKIKGSTGIILLQLLEMRLDSVIFRLGMAPTIGAARQLIGHRHIMINNSCVSIPSYQCKPGNIVSIKNSMISRKLITTNLALSTSLNVPHNLSFESDKLTAKVLGVVDREWVALKLNELFVVEYYSRKI
jgi:small subunit ribosomal protein S4